MAATSDHPSVHTVAIIMGFRDSQDRAVKEFLCRFTPTITTQTLRSRRPGTFLHRLPRTHTSRPVPCSRQGILDGRDPALAIIQGFPCLGLALVSMNIITSRRGRPCRMWAADTEIHQPASIQYTQLFSFPSRSTVTSQGESDD